MFKESRLVFGALRILHTALNTHSVHWHRRLCSDASVRTILDSLRSNAANATAQDLIGGEIFPELQMVRLNQFLGNGIDDCVAELKGTEIVQVLHCYAKLKYVQPSWIERLALRFEPVDLTMETSVLFLASLGTLQRLHDKLKAPRHLLFGEYLPSFVQSTHAPMFHTQTQILYKIVHALGYDKLSADQVATLVYAISQLAPTGASSVGMVRSAMQSLISRQSDQTAVLCMVSASIILFSLCRLDVRDTAILQVVIQGLLDAAKRGGNFPLEKISMVLYSIAKLQFRDRDIIQQLLHEARKSGKLGRFSAWDLSSLFYSLSRLQLRGFDDAVADLGREIARSRRLSRFSEQGLSLVVYALGQMQFKDVSVIQSMLDEALKPMRIEELTFKGLCMMVHGLSKLPYADRAAIEVPYMALLGLLVDTVNTKIESATKLPPHETISLLFGCMLCRSELTDQDKARILKKVALLSGSFGSEFLKDLSPMELLILIKSLSNLGYKDRSVWDTILTHVEQATAAISSETGMATSIAFSCTHPAVLQSAQASGSLRRLMDVALKPETLKRITESNLVNLVHCIEKCQDDREEVFILLISEICTWNRLERFTGHHFVNLICFLLRLEHAHDLQESTLRTLTYHIKLSEVPGNGIVTLLYYFAKHRPRDAFVQKLLDAISTRSEFYASLEADDLSKAVQSFANLKIKDKQMLRPVLMQAVSAHKLEAMTDKGLVLLLHAFMKLKLKASQAMGLIIQQLQNRESVTNLNLDLLSTLLYTLGRCGQYYSRIFDPAFNRLESTDLQAMETLAVVNILDAIARLRLSNDQLRARLANAVCAKKKPLTLVEMHNFLHAVGRLKLQDQNVQQYLEKLIQSDQINNLDAAAMAGLVFAAGETGVTAPNTSDRLLTKALDSSLVEQYREGQLCSITYRAHVFNPEAEGQKQLVEFGQMIRDRILVGAISLSQLGQIIMGFGKLVEKHPQHPIFASALLSLADDHMLNQMITDDLVGHIVAASTCPVGSLPFARKTAAYMLATGCLYSCTTGQLTALKKALLKFDGDLTAMHQSVQQLSDQEGFQLSTEPRS